MTSRRIDFDFMWRRLHALGACKYVGHVRDEWFVDAGYCLDRYSIENDNNAVVLSRP